MLPLCVCLCMHAIAWCRDAEGVCKGCIKVGSAGVLVCAADWQWCDAGCRRLYDNELAALPESFGNLKVGGDL